MDGFNLLAYLHVPQQSCLDKGTPRSADHAAGLADLASARRCGAPGIVVSAEKDTVMDPLFSLKGKAAVTPPWPKSYRHQYMFGSSASSQHNSGEGGKVLHKKQHLPWPLLVLNGGSGASASDNSAASVAQANQRLVEFRKQLKSEQQQLEQYFEDHSSPVFTEAYFRRVKQRARDNCPPAKVVSPTTSAAAAVAAEKTLPNGAARYEEYRRSIQHKIIQGSREQPYTPPNPPTPGIPKPVKPKTARTKHRKRTTKDRSKAGELATAKPLRSYVSKPLQPASTQVGKGSSTYSVIPPFHVEFHQKK